MANNGNANGKDENGLELCSKQQLTSSCSVRSPQRATSVVEGYGHLGGLCRHPRSKLLLQRLHKPGDTVVPFDCIGDNVQYPQSPGSEIDENNSGAHQVSPRRSSSSKFTPPGHRQSISSQKMSFSNYSESFDKVDSLPKEMSFTWIDILAILFSIGSFLFDIGTDIVVAAFHFHKGDYWYFALTTTFIVIPTLIMTGISLRWYVLDSREEGSLPVSPIKWCFRVLFLLLQLGPILRYIDSLIYGLKFRMNRSNHHEQKKYFQYMVYEDTDATMLRLFECFMEAAPQLVLQLYILARRFPHSPDNYWLVLTQCAAVCTSLISLSWSLVSYHRALRMSLPDKINLTIQGMAVMFLWRIHIIGSRVMALALFASIYTYYISIFCGIHWLLMFAWIVSMRTTFCDNKVEELGYNGVLAVMYIFCYFNPVDSPTRYRYATFYVFILFENTLLLCLWFFNTDNNLWYRVPAIVFHYSAFCIGLGFMCLYYLLFHPTKSIKLCREVSSSDGCHVGDQPVDQVEARHTEGYKRQLTNGLWTHTQGRVLHPRPAFQAAALRTSNSDGNVAARPVDITCSSSRDSNPECCEQSPTSSERKKF